MCYGRHVTIQTEQTNAALTQPTTPRAVNEQVLTGWAQILGHALDHSNVEPPADPRRYCRCPNTGHASGVRHYADCPYATPVPVAWKRYGS